MTFAAASRVALLALPLWAVALAMPLRAEQPPESTNLLADMYRALIAQDCAMDTAGMLYAADPGGDQVAFSAALALLAEDVR